MPLTAMSMLAANQPQTPNGTALNASAMLGLPGLGNPLQDDLKQQIADRRNKVLKDASGLSPLTYGASSEIFGGMK